MGRRRPGDGTVRTGRESKGGDISKVAGREQVKWFFDTLATSRKYANLRADPRVALAIGWDAA